MRIYGNALLLLAVLLLCSAPSWAYEALSEEELDRTVASGVGPPPAVEKSVRGNAADDSRTRTDKSATKDQTADEDNGGSAPEVVFTLYAHREPLPIIMHRMTGTSSGPLGRKGNYSLSPMTRARALPTSPVLLNFSVFLPSRSVLFGR